MSKVLSESTGDTGDKIAIFRANRMAVRGKKLMQRSIYAYGDAGGWAIGGGLELSGSAAHHPVMAQPTSSDPLHGVTLEQLLTELVARLGWEEMGRRVPIRCFLFDPSVKSSLTFLRKTPWARSKVEEMYVALRRTA
jgi:hypothetical protein